MQFKLLTIATAFAGLVAAQKSELTPQTVVKSIEAVTDLSQDANNILTDLSFNNVFSLIPVGYCELLLTLSPHPTSVSDPSHRKLSATSVRLPALCAPISP